MVCGHVLPLLLFLSIYLFEGVDAAVWWGEVLAVLDCSMIAHCRVGDNWFILRAVVGLLKLYSRAFS